MRPTWSDRVFAASANERCTPRVSQHRRAPADLFRPHPGRVTAALLCCRTTRRAAQPNHSAAAGKGTRGQREDFYMTAPYLGWARRHGRTVAPITVYEKRWRHWRNFKIQFTNYHSHYGVPHGKGQSKRLSCRGARRGAPGLVYGRGGITCAICRALRRRSKRHWPCEPAGARALRLSGQ